NMTTQAQGKIGIDDQFPARIRIAIPARHSDEQVKRLSTWLTGNCGSENWTIGAEGMHDVVTYAMAIYLRDPISAASFLQSWCIASENGRYRVRLDAAPHS